MEKLNFNFTGNPDNATAMERYMRNRFSFLGLKTPERKKQSKPLLQTSKSRDITTIRQWIAELYARDAREYQYIAIELADKNIKKFQLADIIFLRQFVTKKSWWDSVDSLRAVFGKYIKLHPNDKATVFALFYKSDNMWERRTSINLQLMEKENTDTKMLSESILFDQTTDEFFIQKAIGWSLRQYAKTNPDWVITFLNEHQLSNLAVREATKHL
ncbi:DNA alkylation repair protein [Paucilactobacillus kaifaensis]|uniref:DNA alkylation repair protein n=1 Tax=Paucilactobacillus kaifaensis TaxID=2559921 RepID=UPI0010F76B71|nr:DNA alkylation repair protein [Paucilactobacillus kaifaensis]